MRMCPCMGCGERTVEPNCHDRCPVSERGEWGYAEWLAEVRAERAALRKDDDAKVFYKEKRDRFLRRYGGKPEGQR